MTVDNEITLTRPTKDHQKVIQKVTQRSPCTDLALLKRCVTAAATLAVAGGAVREERGSERAQEVTRHAHRHEGHVVVVEEEKELEQGHGILAQPAALLASLPLLCKDTP